jgi:hypothetical protein
MQVLSYEFFAGHLRETFSISLGETSLEMTLVEARRRPPRTIAGIRAEPFNLYFKCANPVVLPQKMYSFRVKGAERMDIFIVPVGRERDGIVYEAVFN